MFPNMILSFFVLITILVIAYWYRPRRGLVPLHVEKLAADSMAMVDEADFELMDHKNKKVRPTRVRYVATLALVAKNRYGVLSNTAANKQMVRTFLLGVATDHGMRPSHIAKSLDIAVELAFVPSETELVAKQINYSTSVLMRREEYGNVLSCS